MQSFVSAPLQITSDMVRTLGALSPARYRRFAVGAIATKPLRAFLDSAEPFQRGTEPGSLAYVRQSPQSMMRTGALQPYWFSPVLMGETSVPVHPATFIDYGLGEGWHILLSKDANIGEVGLVHGQEFGAIMPSSGMVQLNLKDTAEQFWAFGFIKHPSFKEQLEALVPKGATIAHAKSLWMDCYIPEPDHQSPEFRWVSAAVRTISEWEREIRSKHRRMLDLLAANITWTQTSKSAAEVVFSHERRDLGRLDTGLYSHRYRGIRDAVTDQAGNWTPLTALGLDTRRGQNLQVSSIGVSMEADSPAPGWYRVIKPTEITTEGVLTEQKYLGSPRKLKTVDVGQIVFGGEATWRSMVICEDIIKCTTNIHATILAWPGHELYEVIWLRCWLDFLREHGVLKEIAAGGLGGSLGIRMYEHVPVPVMADETKAQVAKLYFNDACPQLDLKNMEDSSQTAVWTNEAGIWQLDREANALRVRLEQVQNRILRGQPAGV
ncbi:MAG: hypothetical protein WB116_11770 [Candidatus Dormiibacterota bacterium]